MTDAERAVHWTSSSAWRHNICEVCWNIRNPGRIPVRVSGLLTPIETCCFCGLLNMDGIFLRANPEALLCKGIHPEKDA